MTPYRTAAVTAAALLVACSSGESQSGSAEVSPDTVTHARGAATAVAGVPALPRDSVIRARRKYRVKVVSFDASQRFGTTEPYADLVRLRITNGSSVTLPCLTILTKRYDGRQMVSSSRAPSVPTRDVAPGETVDLDYYSVGHMDVANVNKITAEIEDVIKPDDEQFFCELGGMR